MIGSAPRAGWTNVGADIGVLQPTIGDIFQDVGHRRCTCRARTAGPPRVRFPGHQGAVFLCGHPDAREDGRTAARHFQLGRTLEHVAHRLASGFLRDLGGVNAPAVRAKLAAEAAANMVLMNVNIGRLDLQRSGVLSRDS